MTKHRTRNHPKLAYISFNMPLDDFDKWLNKPFRMMMIPTHGEFDMSVTHASFPDNIKCLPASATMEFESEKDDDGVVVSVYISYPCRECGVIPFSPDEVTSVIVSRISQLIGWEPDLDFDE